MGSTPERPVQIINRCSSATVWIRSCNLATFSMRGNHLAYADTQGIFDFYCCDNKNQVKSSMSRCPPEENLLPLFVMSVINNLQCCYRRSVMDKVLLLSSDTQKLHLDNSDAFAVLKVIYAVHRKI